MLRKIIKIDESKCNGCGACASACHEGAIAMVNGVAKLTREDYCDGLGDCLPACPTGAITFEMREAPAYDEAAVKKAQLQKKLMQELGGGMPCGCPGSQAKAIRHENTEYESGSASSASTTSSPSACRRRILRSASAPRRWTPNPPKPPPPHRTGRATSVPRTSSSSASSPSPRDAFPSLRR